MKISSQIAKHFRDIHFGGNWTTTNFKTVLADVTWQEAQLKPVGNNSILTLICHTHYYVNVLFKVLQGGPLEGNDKLSFEHPSIGTKDEWDRFLEMVWNRAWDAAELIENLPDSILSEDFTDKKYGSYYRNITGIIEHLHYHLGQIVIIKKLLRDKQQALL